MRELSPAAQAVLFVFVCFVIAINLSLVFAFRRRNQRPKDQTRQARMPWRSPDAESTSELARRVAKLRGSEGVLRDEDEVPPGGTRPPQ